MAAQARQITVYLIKPSKYDDDGYVLRYRKGFLPSNTLACLAGLTEDIRRSKLLGNALHISVHLCDDTVERIDVSRIARSARHHGNRTIVCLAGVQTNQFPRAADLAFQFRAAGVEVLIGGFHVSGAIAMADALPDEIRSLLDAGVHVVAGEVEDRWGDILADVRDGTLKPMYNFLNEPPDLRHQPIPEINKRYLRHFITDNFGTIDCSRGCPFHCEFCSVSSFFGKSYRTRPVSGVIEELEALRKESAFLFLVDDNLIGNRPYAGTLYKEMTPLKFKWASHAPLNFVKDDELLRLAAQSGCTALFVGFESLVYENLSIMGKLTNVGISPREAVKKFHDHGIGILASFILGYDGDTPDTFDRILDFCDRTKIDGALFPILTPYPGTPLRERLQREGRILTNQWDLYDMEHVTFLPKGMTPEKLQDGFERLNSSFYSWRSIFRRLFKIHRSVQIFGPMNLGFKKAWERVRTGQRPVT